MSMRKQDTTPIDAGDYLPPQTETIERLSAEVRSLTDFYGFERVITPPLEPRLPFTQLAKAGMMAERGPIVCETPTGEDAVVVPSGLFPPIRLWAAGKLHDLLQPIKIVREGSVGYASTYPSPRIVVRTECSFVMIGEETPIAEAEIAQIIWRTLGAAGISGDDLSLRINATGCQRCRPPFRASFISYFRTKLGKLCKNCKRDFKRSPTKMLLCPDEKCRQVTGRAPQMLNFLCDGCKKHLRGFLEFLDEAKIPYFLDAALFKEGLWFGEIVFEFVYAAAPAEDAPPLPPADEAETDAAGTPGREEKKSVPRSAVVCAEGGRLSRAAEFIAGKKVDVAGGSIFFDAIAAVASFRKLAGTKRGAPKIYLAQLGELAKRKSLLLMETLRSAGIEVRESLGRDSIKAQLKTAERLGARLSLILGHKEALDGTIIVRETDSGIQEVVPQEKLVEFLKQKLKSK